MKKTIGLIFFMAFTAVANAQFSAGVDGVFLYPLQNLNNRIDFGIGFSPSVAYSFKNGLAIGLGYEYLVFSSIIPDYKQQSGFQSITYSFSKEGLIPYIGLRTGLFQSSYTAINIKRTDSYFGVSPNLGLMFESGIVSNLKFNTNFSYTNIFSENKYTFLSFRFGVYYYFKL